jgi:hypothetical protein
MVESVRVKDGHVVEAGDEVQRGERGQDARTTDQDRHPGGDQRAEGEHEYDHGEREGVLLGALDVLVAGLFEVLVDGGCPGHVGLEIFRADPLANLLHDVAGLVYGDVEGDHRVRLLPVLRDEPLVFGPGVRRHVADLVQLAHLCQRAFLFGLELLAPRGRAVALEDHRQGRGGELELLGHQALHPLGLGVRALETAALQTSRKIRGEEHARD